MEITDKIDLKWMNNIELMARYSDNYFDLAIVDPPYGIKESSFRGKTTKCAAKKKKI